MKRKRIILAVAAVAFLVLAVAFGIRYRFLNKKYPPAVLREYTVGDVITLEGLEIRFEGKEVLAQEDFFEKYQVNDKKMTQYYEYYPTKFLVAEFHLKNIKGDINNYIRAFSEDSIEYRAFANGEDIDFLKYVNEDKEWDGYLEPEEEKTIKLVYPIPKSLLTEEHWEKSAELPYVVVLRNYKEKIIFE